MISRFLDQIRIDFTLGDLYLNFLLISISILSGIIVFLLTSKLYSRIFDWLDDIPFGALFFIPLVLIGIALWLFITYVLISIVVLLGLN
ncbi:hypothetical protein M9C84_06450 [SAR86 cluster bacterium]|nr:hypothetical protein M9C84_06450 [SAR86 cluster bacterium]